MLADRQMDKLTLETEPEKELHTEGHLMLKCENNMDATEKRKCVISFINDLKHIAICLQVIVPT